MKKLNKKSFLIAAVALLLGGGAYLNYRMATAPVDGMSDLTLANLEAMAKYLPDDPNNPDFGGGGILGFCYSGGKGATQCSIDAGVEIMGVGVSGGCSVSCGPGYYACCTMRCVCDVG